MLAISATNAALAIIIGLTLSNTLRPGDHLTVSTSIAAQVKSEVPEAKKIDFIRELTNYIPNSIIRPFLDNSIISIIILALLSGLALRQVKNEQSAGGSRLPRRRTTRRNPLPRARAGSRRRDRIRPPGRLRRCGEDDRARRVHALVGLAAYVGVAVLGLAIQVLVVYQAWIVFVSDRTLREFWTGARDAVVYALRREQQPRFTPGHAPVSGPDEGLSPVRPARGMRRHESQ